MRIGLQDLANRRRMGQPAGITSVCSAHPMALRAALRHGEANDTTVLIEATCNQVNHLGGYTGMKPADFAGLVYDLAEKESCSTDRIIIGGDHLGPNPWRSLPAEEAMAEAEKMVAAYVAAGFRKLHLDTSMGCAGEPTALDDETTADRACRLAAIAEASAAKGGSHPLYILGTEVPPPGGADHHLTDVPPTDPAAAEKTVEVHRRAFQKAGLEDVFSRVIGFVVQPGVEFGNSEVIRFDRARAKALAAVLGGEPDLIFEAHSTDYQGTAPLRQLVEDGFVILKVGPELTFALREALYALDLIASDLVPRYAQRALMRAMEEIMVADPAPWAQHYSGDAATQHFLRHYSLSDRIRYYWPKTSAAEAVETLFTALRGKTVPAPLFSQHMPAGARFAGAPLDPEDVLIWRIMIILDQYTLACGTGRGSSKKELTDVA